MEGVDSCGDSDEPCLSESAGRGEPTRHKFVASSLYHSNNVCYDSPHSLYRRTSQSSYSERGGMRVSSFLTLDAVACCEH